MGTLCSSSLSMFKVSCIAGLLWERPPRRMLSENRRMHLAQSDVVSRCPLFWSRGSEDDLETVKEGWTELYNMTVGTLGRVLDMSHSSRNRLKDTTTPPEKNWVTMGNIRNQQFSSIISLEPNPMNSGAATRLPSERWWSTSSRAMFSLSESYAEPWIKHVKVIVYISIYIVIILCLCMFMDIVCVCLWI